MLFFRINAFQHIERNGKIRIRRVKVYHVVDAIIRNVIQNLLNKISMRINERKSMSVHNVRDDHVFNERRLSHSGFPDDVHVTATIVKPNTKHALRVSKVCCREWG